MIIKIISNIKRSHSSGKRGFYNLLHYHERQQSELVYTENIIGGNAKEIAEYFHAVSDRGSRVKDPAFHAVISFAYDETDPAPEIINTMVEQYMNKLGYKGQPWCIYRHDDKKHIHYHIVSTRVDIKRGKGILDSFEKKRSFKILQALAPMFGYCVGKGDQTKQNQQQNIRQGLVAEIDQIVRQVLIDDQPHSMYRFIQACKSQGVIVEKYGNGHVVKYKNNRPIGLSKLPIFAEKRLGAILRANKQFRTREMAFIHKNIRRVVGILDKKATSDKLALAFQIHLKSIGINVIYNTNSGGVSGVSFEHHGLKIKGSDMKLSWDSITKMVANSRVKNTLNNGGKTPARSSMPALQTLRRYRTMVGAGVVGRKLADDEDDKKRRASEGEIFID